MSFSTDLQHDFVELGGIRLHYVEAGTGPLVVLLHGFPEFWYSWRHQIPYLVNNGFRVLAPDMRGFNLSDKPAGIQSYRLSSVAEDIRRLIAKSGEKVALVGHDWGGAVAWEFAMRWPNLLNSLVVMNSPHPMRMFHALSTLRQLMRSWYMFFFQLPAVPEELLKFRDYALIRRILVCDTVRPSAFAAEDIDRYVQALSHPGTLTAGINYYRALFRQDPRRVQQQMTRVDLPVLVVWGEHDRYLGSELAQPEPEWVPNAQVTRIPNASHWVQVDQPERVSQALLQFLSNQVSRSAT